jgi:predicted DNA-binding transcriptional regulator AlpA
MTDTIDSATTAGRKRGKAAPFVFPADFDNPASKYKLGSTEMFIALLGVGKSTFANYLSQGLLPTPVRIAGLNRWPYYVMQHVAKNGLTAAA